MVENKGVRSKVMELWRVRGYGLGLGLYNIYNKKKKKKKKKLLYIGGIPEAIPKSP